MTPRAITTIGFDADDTLWQNEQFFRFTETQFGEMLADYAEAEHISSICWRWRSAISGNTASASRASRSP